MTHAPHLQDMQRKFQDDVLQDRSVLPGLLQPRGLAQFGIYQTAYRSRLRGALRENFEVLPLVMGDDAFDALANAYIAAHPSHHYSLRWFGHQLCDFMATNENLVDHPAILDLARMEWALRHAFDAEPATVLTAGELAEVPAQDWVRLHFTLHPSVQLLPLQWAVGPIWHAIKQGHDDLPAPDALAHHMLVWRLGFNTQWKSLSDTELNFAHSLLAGHSFGQACESMAQQVGADDAARAAVEVLRELLVSGALSAMQTRTRPGSLA